MHFKANFVMLMLSLVGVSKFIEMCPEYCFFFGLNILVYIKTLTDLAHPPSILSFSEQREENILTYSDILV